MKMKNEIKVDGIKYVPESKQKATSLKGMPYVIVRTYSAGVFAGYLEKRDGKEGVVRQARRLWFWDGAASLSELAEYGVSKPANCKFPCEVDKIELTEIIEVLSVSKEAQDNISAVPVWTAKTNE
jgi:hypothetical protein